MKIIEEKNDEGNVYDKIRERNEFDFSRADTTSLPNDRLRCHFPPQHLLRRPAVAYAPGESRAKTIANTLSPDIKPRGEKENDARIGSASKSNGRERRSVISALPSRSLLPACARADRASEKDAENRMSKN